MEYRLNAGFAGRTLLSIVQGCMKTYRSNTGTSQWKAGHCTNVGTLVRSSLGIFFSATGTVDVSKQLRIGVGDGAKDGATILPFFILTLALTVICAGRQ